MVTEAAAIRYVKQVQDGIEQPVSVAETSDAIIDHPKFAAAQDYITMHTYPIWVEADIDTGFGGPDEAAETVRRMARVARTSMSSACP